MCDVLDSGPSGGGRLWAGGPRGRLRGWSGLGGRLLEVEGACPVRASCDDGARLYSAAAELQNGFQWSGVKRLAFGDISG